MKILKFYANWCVPCKQMNPIFEEAKKNFINIEFKEINIDEQPEVAESYEIKSIPTIVFIKNGETKKIVGFKPKNLLFDEIRIFFNQMEI